MLFCFNSVSFGANNQNILYYVDGLYGNSESVKSNIRQQSTSASYSCGPTALMFLNNHFSVKNSGINPSFSDTVNSAKSELKGLYSFIGQPYNTTTHLDGLRRIPENRWNWTKVRRMSSTSGVDYNVNQLINYLNDDMPALVVLDSRYPGNPTYGTHGIDHIVIIYAYHKQKDANGNGVNSPYNDRMNDRIYFYDPYYGGNGYFKRGEIPDAVNLSGFAFLRVAP
jgi:hypothetical protein